MIKTETNKLDTQDFGITKTVTSTVKGVIASYIFLIFAFTVLALLYTYTKMSGKTLDILTKLLGCVSIFLAGFVSASLAKNRGWLHGILAGSIHAAVRLGFGLMVFNSYVPSVGFVPTLLVSLGLSALGGIMGVNAVKNRPRKKRKR